MKKIIIGITGGIGSGKSTVSKYIEENGFFVLKADDIAKTIMSENKEIIRAIKSNFGEDSYTKGKLNTNYLAQKVFNFPEKIKKLNNLVHPPTIAYLKSRTQELLKSENIVFVEAALIFEAKMEYLFDYILLVTAEEDIRIKRVLSRENATISEIKSRILNQFPEDQKKGKSDFIIQNDSTFSELKDKVNFFQNIFVNLTK